MGGDWVGSIAGQLGQNGNVSADPQFCDPAAFDYTLSATSPCTPENSGGCDLIGALPVGCTGPVAVAAGLPAARVQLAPAYPNPFNPVTTLVYTLADACHVRLTVYTLDGQRVSCCGDARPGAATNHGHR